MTTTLVNPVTESVKPLADLVTMQEWARLQMERMPDAIIGGNYIRRWWVIPRNPFANVYLHETLRSDSEDELHDHPWDNISVILEGGYLEAMRHGEEVWRKTGDVIQRKATDAHRLIIPDGGRAVSLFITGPKVRDWGFFTANGWQYWEDFIAEHKPRGDIENASS